MSSSDTTEVLSSLLAYLRQQHSNDDGVATRKAIQVGWWTCPTPPFTSFSSVGRESVGGRSPTARRLPADAAYLRCVLERRWIDQKIELDDRAEKEKLLWQQIVVLLCRDGRRPSWQVSVTGEPSSKPTDVDDICDELMAELSLTRRETNHSKRKETERVEPMTDKRAINGILLECGSGEGRGRTAAERVDLVGWGIDTTSCLIRLKSDKDEVEESERGSSLDHLQPEMVEAIEALRVSPSEATMVRDDDIAGLKFAKQTITEVLIMPQRFPQLFASPLDEASKRGTGKTMLGRWIASKVNATFINVSASTLFSKWIGGKREDGQHSVPNTPPCPAWRPGGTSSQGFYNFIIPVWCRLEGLPSSVDDGAIDRLSSSTEGYSGSDIKQLMCAAAMIPIRETLSKLASSTEGDVDPLTLTPRPLVEADLEDALTHSHASEARLEEYIQWNDKFGSWPTQVVMHDE
ncbi:hypothetical protein FOZ60_010847 [Perkinsus olseni]|uniref:Uncharacterized protein n=1 Tax=Perkinsus olseni TaxID=32597 RepID=A0A7J6PBZ2_PEROL|nr:hypothetical protein FOZ60_010847 [Perkinsus olseni]